MSQDTAMRVPLTDNNGNDTGSAIFSADGQPKTQAEFEQAIAQYTSNGTTPKDFKVLSPGVQQFARRLFEAANQPIQEAAKGFGGAVDEATGYKEKMFNPQEAASTPSLNKEALVNHLTDLAHIAGQTPSVVTSQFNTPQKFGAMAGQTAGALASGGSSLPLQVVMNALGAGAGSLAGDALTGGNIQPGEAARQALGAGVGATATGALRWIMGNSLSQQAQQNMAGDLADLLKTKFKSIAGNPQALSAVLSTEQGLSDVVQLGFKNIRKDWQEISNNFVPALVMSRQPQPVSTAMQNAINSGTIPPLPQQSLAQGYVRQKVSGSMADKILYGLNQGAPRTLSNTAAAELRGYAGDMHSLGNELLDNISDTKVANSIQNKMIDTYNKMKTTIIKEFAGSSQNIQQQQIVNLANIMKDQEQQLTKWVDSAKLFAVLKEAGADGQFNPQKFQELLAGRFKQNPGDIMNQAGILAGRPIGGAEAVAAGTQYGGADISQVIDKTRTASIGIPFLKKFGVNIDIPLGNKYVGTVPKQNPMAVTAGSNAIRDYFQSERK